MRTFKEALEAKESEIYLEYEMRAARIVSWASVELNLNKDETEELYEVIYTEIERSDDELDQVAMEVAEKIKLGLNY